MGESWVTNGTEFPVAIGGLVMVHMSDGCTATLSERKDDDSGWWLVEGGGLCDEVIANGSWRPLASVLPEYRAAADFVVWCAQEDYRGPMPEHVRRAREVLRPRAGVDHAG